MSKVDAYRCDECGMIVDCNAASGVKAQPSLFGNDSEVYTIVPPGKADIHICSLCVRTKAISPAAKQVDRKKVGEEVYKAKLHELSVGLMRSAVVKFREKKHG